MAAEQLHLLSPDEFGEAVVSHLPAHAEVQQKRRAYGDARQHGNMQVNPLHSPDASAIVWSGPATEDEEGKFIPTDAIVSGQPQISRDAVGLLVEHSSGLDTPDILVREGSGELAGKYALRDGNHRVNAALERGQMLIPAHVYR